MCVWSVASPDSRARGSRLQYLDWPHTFISPSADSRKAVVSYWEKYVHLVLFNRLGAIMWLG